VSSRRKIKYIQRSARQNNIKIVLKLAFINKTTYTFVDSVHFDIPGIILGRVIIQVIAVITILHMCTEMKDNWLYIFSRKGMPHRLHFVNVGS
jgi:hypothetical protein